jgi:hypothetical protein
MQEFDLNQYQRQRSEIWARVEFVRNYVLKNVIEPSRMVKLMFALRHFASEYIALLDEQLPQAKLYYTELRKTALMKEKSLRERLVAFPFHFALRGKD